MKTAAQSELMTPAQLAAIMALWRQISPGIGDQGLGISETPNAECLIPNPSDAERNARLAYVSEILARPIATMRLQANPPGHRTDVTKEEAQRVIERMKEDAGQEFRQAPYGRRKRGSGPRVKRGIATRVSQAEQTKIAEVAVELFGESSGSNGGWAVLLIARVRQRFGVQTVDGLTPRQARQLIEELLQRIAVRELRGQSPDGPIARSQIEQCKAVLRQKFFTTGP